MVVGVVVVIVLFVGVFIVTADDVAVLFCPRLVLPNSVVVVVVTIAALSLDGSTFLWMDDSSEMGCSGAE